MEDLLKTILRQETETAQAAWDLLRTLPDYNEVRQNLEKAAETIRPRWTFHPTRPGRAPGWPAAPMSSGPTSPWGWASAGNSSGS